MTGARCYIAATGVVFALIFLAHVARVFAEGARILGEPMFLITSVASLGLVIWAGVLLTRRPRA
jgi:hypothetical protein